MELLTEPQLGSLALGIAKLAFVAGLAGALTVHAILKACYAVAEFFAERSFKAARIRAARGRATAPAVPAEAPPLGLYCPENGLYHAWDGDICAVCGAHAPSESLR